MGSDPVPQRLASLVCLAALVSVTEAFDGVVATSCGSYRGTALPQAPGVWAFRGLRYAAPPIDSLRWKPPQAAQCSPRTEILAAENGQACTQKNPVVDITIVSNPGMAARVLSALLLVLASALSFYIYCSESKRCNAAKVERYDSPSTERLLGSPRACPELSQSCPALLESPGAAQSSMEFPQSSREVSRGGPARNVTYWCRCFGACAAFFLGVWLLYFSFAHSIYLGSVLGGEDCLFMNIYAHADALASTGLPLPVLFFVHGGDLTAGAGTDSGPGAIYGGSWALAVEGRAIAVQFNYRLNAFGFLYLQDESGESVLGNSTNLGLLDQIAALRWVQKHISEFGGDPSRVTIYGQSSGGTSIAALLASPLTRGLFHRAFSMSASPRIDSTPAQAALAWRRYFLPALPECVRKWRGPGLRRCLYALPAARIVEAMPTEFSDPSWMDMLPVSTQGGPIIYMAVADGHVVLGNVSDVLARGDPELPGVPTVFGSVREESDLDLKQVRSRTIFDNAAWPFTEQAVMQWGVQLSGDMRFGEKVWRLYKPKLEPGVPPPSNPDASTSPLRERWSQLTSDMRSICGNIHNAKQLARGQDAPVYSYLFTHRPASPVTSHLAGWPAWIDEDSSQYAFHMWDVILLFNRTAGFQNRESGLSYTFTALDFAVANRFRAAVLELAETGRIDEWKAIQHGSPSVCQIDSETTCQAHLKQEECALFDKYGVSYGNWNVN